MSDQKPIRSNSKSNACAQIFSSNCGTYDGPALSCINICKGASLTDVIYAIGKLACDGSTPPDTNNPCFSRGWVDIYSSLVVMSQGATFSGTNCTAIIALPLQNYSDPFTNFSPYEQNFPQYRFTKEGDIHLRGNVNFNLTTTNWNGYINIPLGQVTTSCIPLSSTKNQVVLVDVYMRNESTGDIRGQSSPDFLKAYAVFKIDGSISLLITFDFSVSQNWKSYFSITLGGTVFNLS